MSNLTDYLDILPGGTEIGLYIYNSDSILAQSAVTESGFRIAGVQEVEEHGKYCMILSEENAKTLYDFTVEYQTGQFSKVDKEGRKIWITPDYSKTSILLFAKAELLKQLEEQGKNFLEITGMTYQE